MEGLGRSKFSNVLQRMASFSQVTNSTEISIFKLVSFGLYYDAQKQRIVCCSCEFIMTESMESIHFEVQRHWEEYPNCTFAQKHRENAEQSASEATTLTVPECSNNAVVTTNDSRSTATTATTVKDCKKTNATGTGASDATTIYETRLERLRQQQQDRVNNLRTPTINSTIPVMDTRCARHQHMTSTEARLESFYGNEVYFQRSLVKINDLAAAGFLYTGPKDEVCCFYCDGGLRNFKPNDNPWLEHLRFFPECQYAIARSNLISQSHRSIQSSQSASSSGSNCAAHVSDSADANSSSQGRLTRKCLPALAATSSATAAASRTQVTTAAAAATITTTAIATVAASTSSVTMPKYPLDHRALKARLETPFIKRLISMGYKRDHIRIVLERRLTCTGDDYPGVQPLIEDLEEIIGDSAIPNHNDDSSSSVATRSRVTNHSSGEGSNTRTAADQEMNNRINKPDTTKNPTNPSRQENESQSGGCVGQVSRDYGLLVDGANGTTEINTHLLVPPSEGSHLRASSGTSGESSGISD